MNALKVIKTDFKIPAKYSRQFLFSTPTVRSVILVKDGKVGMADIRFKGKQGPDDTMAWDWMQETMKLIRSECLK
jgi:hypothetical protein